MTKDFYDEVYQADHSFQYGGGEDGMPQRSALLSKKTSVWLDLSGLASKPEAKILEIGCGMAFLASTHPGWHGAEYSKTAIAHVKERDGQAARIFVEDAQCLTFESCSFDGVFSWAALEHVPDPNKAQDLEKRREKLLLKEFDAYVSFAGRKLKETRLEVLRAGFKIAWANKNYKTIIDVANKLSEDTLLEDEKLLLWYDQALTRSESYQ